MASLLLPSVDGRADLQPLAFFAFHKCTNGRKMVEKRPCLLDSLPFFMALELQFSPQF